LDASLIDCMHHEPITYIGKLSRLNKPFEDLALQPLLTQNVFYVVLIPTHFHFEFYDASTAFEQ
jgi:hypothetical protein